MSSRPHRESLEVPGIDHAAPIPMGARVGNMVFSSGIMGKDPQSGDLAEGIESQAHHAFNNMKALMALAGGSVADVGHITVFLADTDYRQHVNDNWFRHFPDEADRPARHVIVQDLPAGMLIQLEIIAVLKGEGGS